MTSVCLDDTHRIVRQVSYAKQIRDEAGNIIGVRYSAFSLREDEDYLSVAWCEYFNCSFAEQVHSAILQLRGVRPDKDSTAYFVLSVGDIKDKLKPHKIRALHEPKEAYECHAALRRWPRKDALLERLAQEAAAQVLMSSDVR
jgi:hypothetical protein